jgi:hypothetical protein
LDQREEKNDQRENLAGAPVFGDRPAKVTGEHRNEESDYKSENDPEHRDLITVSLENALHAEGEVEAGKNRHEDGEHGDITDDDREDGF